MLTESKVARLAARTLLLLARSVFIACALFMCLWLVYGGTLYWRDDVYYQKTKTSSLLGCKDSVLAPVCAVQKLLYTNLVFLLLTPAVMALSAITILALEPSGSSNSSLRCDRVCQWAAQLLPPR